MRFVFLFSVIVLAGCVAKPSDLLDRGFRDQFEIAGELSRMVPCAVDRLRDRWPAYTYSERIQEGGKAARIYIKGSVDQGYMGMIDVAQSGATISVQLYGHEYLINPEKFFPPIRADFAACSGKS